MMLKKAALLLLSLALVTPAARVFSQEAAGSVKAAGQDKGKDDAPKSKKKKTKGSKKGKKEPSEASQYKFPNTLSDGEPKTYRFDSNGNPIPPPSKKKPGKKGKKKVGDKELSEGSDEEGGEKSEDKPEEKSEEAKDDSSAKACSTQESCTALGRSQD